MTFIQRLARDTSGASAAEYALILIIVGAGLVVALIALSGSVANAMETAAALISGSDEAASDAPPPSPPASPDTPEPEPTAEPGSSPGKSGSAPGKGGANPGKGSGNAGNPSPPGRPDNAFGGPK